LFFAGERSLGRRTNALTRQSRSTDPNLGKYRENARWDFGGVTFITVHVVRALSKGKHGRRCGCGLRSGGWDPTVADSTHEATFAKTLSPHQSRAI
jgi:hypothetical protein